MALPVRDGNSSLTNLKTTLISSEHVTHHIVDDLQGTNVDNIINNLANVANSVDTLTTVVSNLSTSAGLLVRNELPTTITRTKFTTTDGSIVWTGANSGSFLITGSSTTRKGLVFTNDNPVALYVSLGQHNTITSTSSAPSQYSFVLFPSGTYEAERSTVNLAHYGYFVSGSGELKLNAVFTS